MTHTGENPYTNEKNVRNIVNKSFLGNLIA